MTGVQPCALPILGCHKVHALGEHDDIVLRIGIGRVQRLHAFGVERFQIGSGRKNVIMFPESLDFMASYCPGIEAYSYKQSVIYLHPVTGNACEVLLFELENSEDAAAVRDILQSHVDERADDTGYPETAAQWKNNARVTSSGSFVFLAVLPDAYELPAQFVLE